MSTNEDDHGFIPVPAWIATSDEIIPEGKLVYLLLMAHSDFETVAQNLDVTADYFTLDRAIFRKGIQSLTRNGAATWVDGVLELRGVQIGVGE